jgi:alpha-beta hydrolase superfamily lysophospholipase
MRARAAVMYEQAVAFLSRRCRTMLAVSLLVMLGAAIWVHPRLIAASLFLRLEKATDPAWLVHYDERSFSEEMSPSGRLYRPSQARGAILLVHGMHEQSIDEPRLVGFARALAGAGFVVLTPRMQGLARYALEPDDLGRIADSARALAALTQRSKVIVFGISFGGGYAIRVACDRQAPIERVIALGAHHDAERVARFYLGQRAVGPAGTPVRIEPHPYGRVALWMSLFHERHQGPFSPAELARVLRGVAEARDDLAAISPSHCVHPLEVPLHLVHGSGDRVVPFSETLWNERQFAPQVRVRSLISPAIVHAEYDPPELRERLQLVAFIVGALW